MSIQTLKNKLFNPSEIHISEGTVYAVLITMGVSHLLNDTIQSVIPAMYPIIKDNYRFTFAQIGLITLFFQLASSIVQPIVGIYADKRPHPYSLTFGMWLTLFGLILLAYANNFLLIVFSVTILGLGSSVFHPEASRVAQMASGGKKSLAQSIFQVGGNAGSAIGPLLAAWLILPYGQHAVSWVGVIAVIAAVILFEVGRWYSAKLTYMKQHPKSMQCTAIDYSRRKKYGAMTILVVLMFSKYIYTSCMTNYFTFFLMEKFDLSVQNAQYCLFAYLAAMAIGTLAGGVFGDKFGRKYVILGSIFGAAPFALILPYVSLGWTIFIAIMAGLIISSAFSSILVYATDLYPKKVGMISGLFFGLMYGLAGVGSAFFGWLADRTSIEFIFHVSTLLPLLGIVATFLPNPQKQLTINN